MSVAITHTAAPLLAGSGFKLSGTRVAISRPSAARRRTSSWSASLAARSNSRSNPSRSPGGGEVRERLGHDPFGRRRDPFREAPVGVQNDAFVGHGRGTVPHRLDHHPVGEVGTLKREHPVALGRPVDQRVDVAVADRAQGLLGLIQSPAQLVRLLRALAILAHRVPRA
jgi:hypothetical protein